VALRRLSGETMGTTWSVQALAPRSVTQETVAAAIAAQLQRVIDEMSTWEADSLISRFNRAPPAAGMPCRRTLHRAGRRADHGHRQRRRLRSHGRSAGGLWGFGAGSVPRDALRLPTRPCWPTPALRLAAHRAGPGSARVQQAGGVSGFFRHRQGYAVDLVAQALRECGCVSWLAEVGGELAGQGVKADGQPWWVALERPPQDDSPAMVVACTAWPWPPRATIAAMSITRASAMRTPSIPVPVHRYAVRWPR
jgi:thiamine biosynthesis lipoprotein